MIRHRLSGRPLSEPHPERFPLDVPARSEIVAAHAAALGRGDLAYTDPVSGLFVMTAVYLADRGSCCDKGCRHCPYLGGPDFPDLGD